MLLVRDDFITWCYFVARIENSVTIVIFFFYFRELWMYDVFNLSLSTLLSKRFWLIRNNDLILTWYTLLGLHCLCSFTAPSALSTAYCMLPHYHPSPLPLILPHLPRPPHLSVCVMEITVPNFVLHAYIIPLTVPTFSPHVSWLPTYFCCLWHGVQFYGLCIQLRAILVTNAVRLACCSGSSSTVVLGVLTVVLQW